MNMGDLEKEEHERIFADDEQRYYKFKRLFDALRARAAEPAPKAKVVKRTYKGKSCRVQFIAVSEPGRPTRFLISTLPAAANKHIPFKRGKLHYAGREFSKAWSTLWELLDSEPGAIPRSLSEYAKKK